ncbi:MAG: class I SAM-dependent methyltransferase, partial [Paracoccaceae bacterium]
GDLGAGWGFLSRAIAAHPDVTTLHLIEADHDALSCAKSNVTDPRARFHWADATRWDTPELLDTVVMNPPFHIGRKADPALGQAFITAAARNLKPRGRLLMVANRHLPYEADIETCFATQRLVSDANGFKIIEALSPRLRGPRTGARSQAARPTTRHRLS